MFKDVATDISNVYLYLYLCKKVLGSDTRSIIRIALQTLSVCVLPKKKPLVSFNPLPLVESGGLLYRRQRHQCCLWFLLGDSGAKNSGRRHFVARTLVELQFPGFPLACIKKMRLAGLKMEHERRRPRYFRGWDVVGQCRLRSRTVMCEDTLNVGHTGQSGRIRPSPRAPLGEYVLVVKKASCLMERREHKLCLRRAVRVKCG